MEVRRSPLDRSALRSVPFRWEPTLGASAQGRASSNGCRAERHPTPIGSSSGQTATVLKRSVWKPSRNIEMSMRCARASVTGDTQVNSATRVPRLTSLQRATTRSEAGRLRVSLFQYAFRWGAAIGRGPGFVDLSLRCGHESHERHCNMQGRRVLHEAPPEGTPPTGPEN